MGEAAVGESLSPSEISRMSQSAPTGAFGVLLWLAGDYERAHAFGRLICDGALLCSATARPTVRLFGNHFALPRGAPYG
jgi:hypothetical protein